MSMKKIYFCGSIRGGRDDVELYRKIISLIKSYGYLVLTEHIASPDVFGIEKEKSDHDIWVQDMTWLSQADLVIAECSTPSLGVGYELAEAKHLNKSTIAFARKEERAHTLSAMIAGDPYYTVYTYTSENDILEKIKDLCEEYR